MDATQLVVGIFQGAGVTISNANLVGSTEPGMAAAVGFSAPGIDILPPQGVLLTTGHAEDVSAPADVFLGASSGSFVSDPDLELLLGVDIAESVTLEFDFVPEEDQVLFDFVFASEEYPEFICDFNDGFGFFLSGPGIEGPFDGSAVNIALIPGTELPVSIDNVNNGRNNDPDDPNCPAVNPELFVDNTDGAQVAFDGMTTILPVQADVIPGSTYHIKIVIGDAIDGVYDSGLFLMANSFRSAPSINTRIDERSGAIPTVMWEGTVLRIRSLEALGQYRILDLQGRVVHSGTSGSTIVTVPLEGIGPGVHFLYSRAGIVRCIRP